MEENEILEENPEVIPEENEDAGADAEAGLVSQDENVTYIDIGTASISVNELSEETSEPLEITEPSFDFNFISYVGSGGSKVLPLITKSIYGLSTYAVTPSSSPSGNATKNPIKIRKRYGFINGNIRFKSHEYLNEFFASVELNFMICLRLLL